MSAKNYYQCCAVPCCGNSTVKAPSKLFIHVPEKISIRKKWLDLARVVGKTSPKSSIFFCEDHFDLPNDMENYMEYHIMGSVKKISMKPTSLPSKFKCQPDRKKLSSAPQSAYGTFLRKELIKQLLSNEEVASTSSTNNPAEKISSLAQSMLPDQPKLEDKSIQVHLIKKYRSKSTQTPKQNCETSGITVNKANIAYRKMPISKSGATKKSNFIQEETSDSGSFIQCVPRLCHMDEADQWLERPDVCRCCLATSGSWDLTGSYMSDDGETEVLLDMLRESLGVRLPLSEFGPSRFVCDTCATSLRHAHNFKRQVLRAEERFAAYLREREDGKLEIKTEDQQQQAVVDVFETDEVYEHENLKIKSERLEQQAAVDIFPETEGVYQDIEIKIESEDLNIEYTSNDHLETIQRSPSTEQSTDNIDTKEISHSTHSSTNMSKVIQPYSYNTDHAYTTMLEDTKPATDAKTDFEPLTCCESSSSTPTLHVRQIRKRMEKSDPIDVLGKSSSDDGNMGASSSGSKQKRKRGSSGVRIRKKSSGGESMGERSKKADNTQRLT